MCDITGRETEKILQQAQAPYLPPSPEFTALPPDIQYIRLWSGAIKGLAQSILKNWYFNK